MFNSLITSASPKTDAINNLVGHFSSKQHASTILTIICLKQILMTTTEEREREREREDGICKEVDDGQKMRNGKMKLQMVERQVELKDKIDREVE